VLLAIITFAAGVSSADEDLELLWSGTLEMRLKDFQSPADDDSPATRTMSPRSSWL
jgi:hypothetical protein